jgi:hypothetical protein
MFWDKEDKSEEETAKKDRVKLYRELRVKMLSLQKILYSISKGEKDCAELTQYINPQEVDGFAKVVENIIKKIEQYEIEDDECICRIKDLWMQLSINPLMKPPDNAHLQTPANQNIQPEMRNIKNLENIIREIVFIIGYETIPYRLREWLARTWDGNYIPFHLVFEDEIPLMEDRVRLLELLAYAPGILEGGLISLGDGLIYRYAKSKYGRRFSILLLLVVLSISTWVVINSGGDFHLNFFNLFEWEIPSNPIVNWPSRNLLIIGWIAVLTGIVVHLAVAAAKIQQKNGRPPLISINHFDIYISARSGWIVWKLVLALIGLFGTIYAVASQNQELSPATAILVGYSLDSVVDLFGTSMEQMSTAQIATLKKQLGVTQ